MRYTFFAAIGTNRRRPGGNFRVTLTSGLIAVIGGGPAGAMAAERLARGGCRTVLIDEKLAWEKPCGGGITPKAMLRYPYLADAAMERNWVEHCELISPAGRRVSFTLAQKLAIFSRRVLNGFMLERARAAGADILQDRVLEIAGHPGAWRVRTHGHEVQAAFIIIATGARNPFRAQFSRPFTADEMMVTAGYYVPGSSKRVQLRFLQSVEGYIWTFPRADHFSAGIAGRINDRSCTTADLRRMLEAFLRDEGFDYRGAPFFAHIIPAPTAGTLGQGSFCGDGWAMVGDAAGLVDPITGEGLYYAFRSAELAADALLANRPARYAALLAKEILPELTAAAGYANRFYRGSFRGQPVLERMVQYISENPRFRDVISDLFGGSQAYVTLRGRCYRELLPAVWKAMSAG
jgi:geranylgeranyl reductase family protein